MKKIRLALAGAALTAAVAPVTAAPAHAMACHPQFDVVCFAIGTVCRVVDELPKAECVTLY